MTGLLRTGQVAEAAGVNIQTLRYYERRGLLAEPERSLGVHRMYPAEAVTTLRVIKAAQRLGFTPKRSPTCSTPAVIVMEPRPTPDCDPVPAPNSKRSRRASPT